MLITKTGYEVNFSYGVGGKRFKRIETNYSQSSQPKHTHYVGNVEFVKAPSSSVWIAKRYIGDKILITKVNTTQTVRYLLTDHLGSTHVIAKANGQKEQEMSFDVFGARRNATTWAREHHKIPQFTNTITLRGYTGHEQLDELSLVHMGGRIYDPILGRFLQADPAIQQPNNIQSFDRYSYVMNNPLNKTDPSGYIWVTLATYALKSLAANMATSMLATAINFALAAYQFYGEFQLYKGIINAIEGGGTAMANFAGGFAKSYVKGMLEGAVIQGIGMAISSKIKTQGNSETETKNGDSAPSNEASNAGKSGSEPPNPSNKVAVNTPWKKGQKVTVDENGDISVKLNVARNPEISEDGFKLAVEEIQTQWTGSFSGSDGKTNKMSVELNVVSDLDSADLIFEHCEYGSNGCSIERSAHVYIGTPKQNRIFWSGAASTHVKYPQITRLQIGAHEFGHTMGLYHQVKGSGSIMSYDEDHSAQPSDMERLRNAYK